MIDLHTHTNASDGRCSPSDLVARAAAAGVRVLGLTDHDTAAACDEVAVACGAAGIEFVPGIEITAVLDGVDVHVLGYWIDVRSEPLLTFLARQRLARMDRVRRMVDRLAALDIALDADAILGPGASETGRAAGRPWIARALVAAGYVQTANEAFDRFLSRGRPAFVPRIGAPPEEVFKRIHESGGLTSLAHPGLLGLDGHIPAFADAGLDALEAYHTDHDADVTDRYLRQADALGLAVSGGSDYHADESHGAGSPGCVSLPPDAFETLRARAARVAAKVRPDRSA